MKVLCVAEKPSIAKSITEILSDHQARSNQGRDKFCRNFEFQYRITPNHSYDLPAITSGWAEVTMTSVRGHLMEQDFSDTFRRWHSCPPSALLDAPIETTISKDCNQIARNLTEQVRGADVLVIWTDCDREGEHIGAEIVGICRTAKRNIAVKRARFSAIIKEQIHQAMQHPVELDWNAVAAVECRIELDLRLGAAFTRLQSLQLQRHFTELERRVISYGPCQFPTLGFVVEKYCEVMNFVPQPFWYIYVMHKRENMQVEFRWARNHLFVQQDVKEIFDRCKLNPEASVTSVKKRPTKKFKPQPLTTVELQKSGGNLLRLAPKRILDIAEKLYQQGILSYPRTETDQFDPAFDFRSCIDRHKSHPDFGTFATKLLDEQGAFEKPINGRKNDKAHPPIHPTRGANNLSGDEKRVFDYVTRRFLASCSKHAVGEQTEIKLDIAKETFNANGVVVLQRNYLDVFPFDTWGGPALPRYNEGERFKPTKLEMKEGETTRPKLLTEAALVGLMDKNGIGTDATIAEHIAKIIERDYVMIHEEGKIKYLVPSTLGVGLVEGHNAIRLRGDKSLCKPDMRRETEEKMALICDGVRNKQEILQESLEEYGAVMRKVEEEMHRLIGSVKRYVKGEEDSGTATTQAGGGDGPPGPPSPPAPAPSSRTATMAPPRTAQNRVEVIDLDDDDDDSDRKPTMHSRQRNETLVPSHTNIPMPRQHSQQGFQDSTLASSVQCHCSEDARQNTVRKEGANNGRQFWSCAKHQNDEKRCTFFEWADNRGNGATASSSRAVPAPTAHDVRRCECGLEAVRLVASKAGARKGQAFWKCPNISKKAQCGYFEWEQESDGVRAVTNDDDEDARSAQRCFKCGQAGHWSDRCDSAARVGDRPAPTYGSGSKPSGSRAGTQSGECFSCGEAGHWTNACPNRDAGSSRAGKFAAQRRPPSATDGRDASGGRSKGKCFNCGNEGHWSSDCPDQGSGGGGGASGSRGRPGRANSGRSAGAGGPRKRRKT